MAVVARTSCRIAGARAKTWIRKGALYDETSPVVLARPWLFEQPAQHQARTRRPTGTPDLGRRSQSARHHARGAAESARQAPGERRTLDYPCPVEGCDFAATSERAVKTHLRKVHNR